MIGRTAFMVYLDDGGLTTVVVENEFKGTLIEVMVE